MVISHPELVFPFITYAIVTTFTPGPNNASSSQAGMQQGFSKTIPYLTGISIGFFAILAACGLMLDFILNIYGTISPYLRWIGALYMLWLALMPFLKSKQPAFNRQPGNRSSKHTCPQSESKSGDSSESKSGDSSEVCPDDSHESELARSDSKISGKKIKSRFAGYTLFNGMVLQLVNVKVILYGITLYSSFSLLIGTSATSVLASAFFLTVVGFFSIAVWTLIGSTFSAYFKNKIFYYTFNVVMSLMLIYSAVAIVVWQDM